ncbi:MAG: Ig-like domain-containing protein [Bacteroidales bacterium]|nr:Ig-like domain-containing protein [Bacteroidales bacterium]
MKKHLLFKFLLALFLFAGWQSSFGQVFITELADPNNNSGARFVELYNAGSSSVDFSTGWKIGRYTNDNTVPQTPVNLTGTIPAKGFYIISPNGTEFNTVYGFAADQSIGTGGPADSNGDDKIYLINASDENVDIFGVPGEDSNNANTAQNFEDGRAERKETVTTGNTTWDANEWNVDNDQGFGDGTQDAPADFDPGEWIGTLPIISNIAHTPVSVTPSDAVNVTADVDANSNTINAVAVNWGTSSGSLTNPITMTNTGGNAYDADSDIPAQTGGTTVYYEIAVAYNTTETKTSEEQSYTVILGEPTNQATSLAESDKTNSSITLTWTDADAGTQVPDGYIIKAEAGDGTGIVAPVDGTDETETTFIKKVAHGIQTVDFTGLTENTEYTFKMWSYTNSGIDIDYKLDGTIPEVSVTTPESFVLETFDADLGHWNTYNESGDTKFWEFDTDHAHCNGWGSSELEIDWLISPVLNHSFLDNPHLIFDLWWQYGSDDGSNYLKLYYSTDYNGDTTNLGTATWTELTFPTPGSSSTWTTSGGIDISAISGDFYLAYEYHYTDYRSWGVDNITFYGTNNASAVILLQSPLAGLTFDTEENVTVDFVTYNQTDLLTLEVWNEAGFSWDPFVTDIDPAAGTLIAQVPANAEEASTYKLRLLDQTDQNPISNEVPFAINDITGPVFNSYTPADESSDVVRTQSLQIDFDEDVKAGTGNIIIKQYNSDIEVVSYPIADAAIVITETTVTVNHTTDWPNDSMLYVEIAAGVIVDMQDNAQFSITDKDTWNFEIADEIAPIYTFDPADAATNVARNTAITISFDEAIYAIGGATFDNTSTKALLTFTLTDAGGANVPFDATINGTNDIITITPNTLPLDGLTDYYYAISDQYEDASANQGASGNATFTTVDDAAPIVTITPANGSTDIGRDTTIAIEFDRAVRKLDDSPVVDGDLAAMITLKETDGSGADVAFTATINAGKDSISVVPDATLKANQLYFVEIADELESDADVAIAITNASFTTIDDEAPIAAFDPADAETDVVINSSILITFNEAILNTDASAIDDTNVDALITLKDTDAAGTNITFDATIDVNKEVITIVPTADFDYNQDVFVSVAAVEDAAGNESVLQSATFTTIANNDATLSDLTVDGETVDGFSATIYTYNVEVPYGTTVVPTVAATENDPDANAVVTQATNLDGTEAERTATVVVTAEDGTTELTYSIVFSIGPEGGLFFSEYIEGDGGNNKALEIYNPTDAEVDLSNYVLRGSANDATGWEYLYIFPDGATIAAKDVYVIVDDGADAALQDVADWSAEYAATVTGNDARGLFKIAGSDTTLIDIIGNPNNPDGNDFDVAGITGATANHTLIRKPGIIEGNIDWTTSSGTNADDSEWEVHDANYFDDLGSHSTSLSSEAEILTFTFGNDIDLEPATITTATGDVAITVINGTDASALTPTITVSDDAEISPVSGLEQDFTSPVVYTVTAEDESTKDWTVTVTVSATLNDESDFLSFEIENMDSVVLDTINHTIDVYMPYGTNDDALIPIFTLSPGATANPESGVVTDFSYVVDYRVTAQDGSYTDWQVAVFVQNAYDLSIYEIQWSTVPSGDSQHLGALAKTYGVVTGVGNDGFFMQDSAKAWNGVYVFTDSIVNQGDSISIVATVEEYQNGTQLINVLEINRLNTGVTIPDALSLTVAEALEEKYEGVLISLSNLECIDGPSTYKEWTFTDTNSNEIMVDDILGYQHTFTIGGVYNITGARQTYYGDKITPRDVNDINAYPVIDNITLDPTTPSSTDAVTITATITDEEVAADALTVGLYYGAAEGSEDTEVTFTQVGTTDEFEGTIPASSSDVFYKITASDGSATGTATGTYSVTAVGINNPDGIVSMNIYPNPSNGNFTLEMNASKAGTFNVEIINIQGQVVFTKEINQDGFYKETIDISNNASGIYYLRINDGKNLKVSKIMIQ